MGSSPSGGRLHKISREHSWEQFRKDVHRGFNVSSTKNTPRQCWLCVFPRNVKPAVARKTRFSKVSFRETVPRRVTRFSAVFIRDAVRFYTILWSLLPWISTFQSVKKVGDTIKFTLKWNRRKGSSRTVVLNPFEVREQFWLCEKFAARQN